MKVTKLSLNSNALMNLFLNTVQKELERLFFDSNQQIIIYLKNINNSHIIVSNLSQEQNCCPIKLIKTLKKTKSISLKESAPNNFWKILSNCQV